MLEEIVETFESCGNLSNTAKALELSITKVRKALITAGAYSNETSVEVEWLRGNGKTIEEISRIMNLSLSAI